MNLKRKQKWVLSLVVTFSMLFSTMGMAAAAEPIGSDARSTVTVDTEPEPPLITTEDETESETKSEDDETAEETTDSEEETSEETKSETDEETDDETEDETEPETDDETGDETEPETGDETGDETEPETDGETEDETEPETDGETEDETEPETDGETEDETESETGDETEDETEPATDGEINNGNVENPNLKPPVDLIPDVHEHSWSVDWNYDGSYHWHECDAEDCPVLDNSEKDGYAEHIFDDYGVCIDCGYDAMDGIAVVAAGDVPTYQEAYEAMIALKEDYPEGMTWTNFEPYGTRGELGDAYTWKGGSIYGAKSGVGCMAFAFILSDAAFGSLPARAMDRGSFTFDDVKVGDILRVNGNSHSVIVLQKSAGGVIVAEANYNKSVHWGRAISAADVEDSDFIITRYPKDYVPSDDFDADEIVEEGTAGDLEWSLTNGGVLTISGTGAIPNYSLNNSPWNDFDFYTVVIDDGVTGIGDYAFYGSEVLSVYIPDSVTSIGQSAFRKSALVAVTIPGSVETIADSAFRNCENLTSATVCEGVTTIEDNAFRACMTLAYIDFPASITSVGAGAFMDCEEMVSVRFMPGSGTVTLGDNLFSNCYRLMRVTLPQTTDRISAGMFASCTLLPSLYIPTSVEEIGENPFTSCQSLKVIYFGGSETQWNQLATAALRGSLQSTKTTVEFDIEFDDPFATDPNDPGDFVPGDDESCTDHVDEDNDGRCDNCGEIMPSDTPEPDDGEDETKPGGDDNTTKPDDGEDITKPDDGEKDPSGSGSDNKPPTTDNSSGGSSDRSDDSSDSWNEPDDNSISTSTKWYPDGSSVATKTQKNGSVATITTDSAGKVEMDVRLSVSAISTANQRGEALTLPISAVSAVKDVAAAPAITVHTQKDELVKVAIPTVSPTPGTVAVMVLADGSTQIMKASVPTANSVVAFLPDGATVKIVDNSKSFSDVPAGAWYENAVAFVSARELFYSTTESIFAPEAPMTYSMLMTALARFDGAQTDGGTTWYAKSMEWAAARGINNGTNPDSNITGEQLVTVLWKYLGSPAGPNQINDTQTARLWAVENGIISGIEDGSLNLEGQVNHAQAAQIIMNFAKKSPLVSHN